MVQSLGSSLALAGAPLQSHVDGDICLQEMSCSPSLLGVGVREEKDPKNNPCLTHFALNLTGLPAGWGSAWPIFLSIFSRDFNEGNFLLGWKDKAWAA